MESQANEGLYDTWNQVCKWIVCTMKKCYIYPFSVLNTLLRIDLMVIQINFWDSLYISKSNSFQIFIIIYPLIKQETLYALITSSQFHTDDTVTFLHIWR